MIANSSPLTRTVDLLTVGPHTYERALIIGYQTHKLGECATARNWSHLVVRTVLETVYDNSALD